MAGSRWGVSDRCVAWIVIGAVLVVLFAGCGGAPATPTPLPAVARPEQPTPVYAQSTAFRLVTPVVTPQLVTQPPSQPALAAIPTVIPAATLDSVALLPPATALGIVRGGATLLTAPNGAVIQQLPAGATITLTGKSADGGWLAAYSARGESGWVAASSLVLFGEETLAVVTEATGPGEIAALLATAMAPVAMPTIVLTMTVGP